MTDLLKMNPSQLVEEKCRTTDDYVKLAELKVGYEKKKAEWWKINRKEYKSDTSTERAYDLTEQGLSEKEIATKMKAKLMRISSINSLIEVRKNEAFGNY